MDNKEIKNFGIIADFMNIDRQRITTGLVGVDINLSTTPYQINKVKFEESKAKNYMNGLAELMAENNDRNYDKFPTAIPVLQYLSALEEDTLVLIPRVDEIGEFLEILRKQENNNSLIERTNKYFEQFLLEIKDYTDKHDNLFLLELDPNITRLN